ATPAVGGSSDVSAAPGAKSTASKSHTSAQPSESDSKRAVPGTRTPEADHKSTPSAAPEKAVVTKDPVMKPVAPDVRRGICKDGPCPVCPPGQSPGKNNSCVSAPLAKGTPVPQKGPTTPQACPAGQVWNGVQCALIGAQQCLPGQITVGSSCHVDC